MSDEDDELELVRLERARLRSLVDGDMAAAVALHADAYELIPPSGLPLTRSAYLESIGAGTLRYDTFEPSGPVRCRLQGETAILRYIARVVVTWDGGSDDTILWHTDYWERRDGRWQAVWSHASRLARPDPD